MAIRVTLTLEPNKSLCTISTLRLVFLLDGLAQSPSEAVPFNLWEGPGVRYSLDRQSVALWEDVFLKNLCLLNVREIGFPPRTLLEFQTASLRLEIEPFWMFVAHCLIPMNCRW